MLSARVQSSAIAAAFVLDLALGDPPGWPHPVRAFGWLAGRLEACWRPAGDVVGLRVAGAGFTLTAVTAAAAVVSASLRALPGRKGRFLVSTYWVYALLATRDLDRHALAVVEELERGDLPAARNALSRIVGRDTEHLDEAGIVRAVIETIAENLSDAVVAPLFFCAWGGPVAMAAYKAANTLDSMVGYRDERYREFGWASARLDDLFNLAPARLTAALAAACAPLAGLDGARAARTVLRDAHRQPSPNAGYPEAAVAGALGVRLGGVNTYRGAQSHKAFLGEPAQALSVESFRRCRRLLYGVAVAAAGLAVWFVARNSPSASAAGGGA